MNDAQVTKALKVMELVSPSPAFGTEEGGPPTIGYLGHRRMGPWRCNWCAWEGPQYKLVNHWLRKHDGRLDFEVR